MTCHLCAQRSGTHDLTKPCCAARLVMAYPPDRRKKTATHIAQRYGHTLGSLRKAAAEATQ